ncbi:uncharacterized protein BX663DRAFT_467934 [Cokeromyces recurvatus]|uniref:uncharacterized protein n=1 Tax=Cokeromyces recurvatus TaxID=90255 RepID=UPI00221EC100|nr:uncharacterized protein BX663DRAFT_467934 [Cokeromyces recurvatus]KAI7905435.1 hypothetical protein BX663DRAFT_467934 [Cokeromyces recurvatus]
MISHSPISRLSDDCLELIFQACEGCPWTLRTISEVCRKWYAIVQRPSVLRVLQLHNSTNFHAAYTRLLTSNYKIPWLKAVRILIVSKSAESRHAHLRSFPLKVFSHITTLQTSNLCLAEIKHLFQHIFLRVESGLRFLICKNIETWCDTVRFDFELIKRHPHLQQVQFSFMEDGHSGFASIHNTLSLSTSMGTIKPVIRSFTLVNIRDAEYFEQRNLLAIMEEVENDQEEIYAEQDLEQHEGKKNLLMEGWRDLEQSLVRKYSFFASLNHLEHLEFGFCYAWTPKIWRNILGKIFSQSPQLKSLTLYGWDQLGKLEKIGSKSSTIQPTRVAAESAIAECFELLPNLISLKLIDFSIGPGLLRAAKHIAHSLRHLDIVFGKNFLRHINEPAGVWLLLGPLKEFITYAFSKKLPTIGSSEEKTIRIYLHPILFDEVESAPFFSESPLLKSIQESINDPTVKIELIENYHA